MKLKSYPLSHFNERPQGIKIDCIVIHSMYAKGEARKTSALRSFQVLEENKVSSHYSIDRRGQVWQHVAEDKRAWHAGESLLDGKSNVNDFSIGIELIGVYNQRFRARQYRALISLIKDISLRQPIKVITSHSHIAPGRKIDPGPSFCWQKLKLGLRKSKSWKGRILP
jgi:AmpD protein